MPADANKELVRRWIEQGALQAAQGNADAVHEYLHDHYVNHTPMIHDTAATGVDAVKDNYAEAGRAIQDLQSHADLILGDGDLVAVHWTAQGTHSGSMKHRHAGELPGSGQGITVAGVFLCRVRDGKIVESWSYDNHMDYLVSIGALSVSA